MTIETGKSYISVEIFILSLDNCSVKSVDGCCKGDDDTTYSGIDGWEGILDFG